MAWQKPGVSSEDSCQRLWRGWGGFTAKMSHHSLFYLVSFCQGLRHFLFSFFCRLSSPHCGFLHSQRPGSARIGERSWLLFSKHQCAVKLEGSGVSRCAPRINGTLIIQLWIINKTMDLYNLVHQSHLHLGQKFSEE